MPSQKVTPLTPEAPTAPAAPHKSLAAALLAAQKQVGTVGKTSSNEYDKYAYTSADTMVAHCRDALNDQGLLLSRVGHTIDRSVEPHDVISHLLVEYPETGEAREYDFRWPIVGNQKRLHAVDKALAGALTTSLAYFQRDLLNVPRADANEMEKREDTEAPRPPATPTEESRTLQAECAAQMGLLRKSVLTKATVYLDRAGHEVALLTQLLAWIIDHQPKPGDPPEEPTVEKVDPATGEVLDPESPDFGMSRGEDGP